MLSENQSCIRINIFYVIGEGEQSPLRHPRDPVYAKASKDKNGDLEQQAVRFPGFPPSRE